MGQVLGQFLGRKKCLLNYTPGLKSTSTSSAGEARGPPLLELVRREQTLPGLAHLEAVLQGLIVQGNEYLLQDVFQIPVKKCVEANSVGHGVVV